MSESSKDPAGKGDIIYTISGQRQDEKGNVITMVPVGVTGKPEPGREHPSLGDKPIDYDASGKSRKAPLRNIVDAGA